MGHLLAEALFLAVGRKGLTAALDVRRGSFGARRCAVPFQRSVISIVVAHTAAGLIAGGTVS